jgi:hypothetical protein
MQRETETRLQTVKEEGRWRERMETETQLRLQDAQSMPQSGGPLFGERRIHTAASNI